MKILKFHLIFARPLPKLEEYVGYTGRRLNLSGYTIVDVKEGKKPMKNARVVIARKGQKSLIGRDRLAKLNFRVAESNITSEYNNSINHTNINNKPIKREKSVELKKKKRKFRNIFTRQGRIVGHTIKKEYKERAKFSQQKGAQSPIQLQEAVHAE